MMTVNSVHTYMFPWCCHTVEMAALETVLLPMHVTGNATNPRDYIVQFSRFQLCTYQCIAPLPAPSGIYGAIVGI